MHRSISTWNSSILARSLTFHSSRLIALSRRNNQLVLQELLQEFSLNLSNSPDFKLELQPTERRSGARRQLCIKEEDA